MDFTLTYRNGEAYCRVCSGVVLFGNVSPEEVAAQRALEEGIKRHRQWQRYARLATRAGFVFPDADEVAAFADKMVAHEAARLEALRKKLRGG